MFSQVNVRTSPWLPINALSISSNGQRPLVVCSGRCHQAWNPSEGKGNYWQMWTGCTLPSSRRRHSYSRFSVMFCRFLPSWSWCNSMLIGMRRSWRLSTVSYRILRQLLSWLSPGMMQVGCRKTQKPKNVKIWRRCWLKFCVVSTSITLVSVQLKKRFVITSIGLDMTAGGLSLTQCSKALWPFALHPQARYTCMRKCCAKKPHRSFRTSIFVSHGLCRQLLKIDGFQGGQSC